MKSILKVEELAMTAIAIYFLYQFHLGISWWLWIILFLSPDISMFGYLINTQTGAFAYNLFHHKGFAILVAAIGLLVGNGYITSTGVLLFAHASFDRIWGYGLKYPDSFKNTHLGSLKKGK